MPNFEDWGGAKGGEEEEALNWKCGVLGGFEPSPHQLGAGVTQIITRFHIEKKTFTVGISNGDFRWLLAVVRPISKLSYRILTNFQVRPTEIGPYRPI